VPLRDTLPAPPVDKKVKRIVECISGMVFEWSPKLMTRMRPGFATTLHTMQSDSADHAILVDDGKWPELTRQFLYTAASRARKTFTYLLVSKNATSGCTAMDYFRRAIFTNEKKRLTELPELLGTRPDHRPSIATHCIVCSKRFVFTITTAESGWCDKCEDCSTALADMVTE
jgi:hypothetical protein